MYNSGNSWILINDMAIPIIIKAIKPTGQKYDIIVFVSTEKSVKNEYQNTKFDTIRTYR